MNKQELIEAIADTTGLTKKTVTEVMEAMIRIIVRQLKSSVKVTMTGFGTFRVSSRRARSGVSPRDPQQRIQIPAVKIPAFTAGKTFKDLIR